MSNHYQHWQVQGDELGILWLYLDRQDSRVNTLHQSVLLEFATILENVDNAKGIVIASKKDSGFIAGADIQQFTQINTVEEAQALIQTGQMVFAQLANLKIPTIALINGFCVGGGLELALACRYRVAVNSPKTRLGLPEVRLGIHPGWGGTVRLPALIGATRALDLILSGRTVDATTAAKLGIVDVSVPEQDLQRAAHFYILQQPKPHRAGLNGISNHAWLRPLLHKWIHLQLLKKVNPAHYPAPFAALDNWYKYGIQSAAYAGELSSISRLMMGDTAKNLIRVFFLQERLKGLAKGSEFKAQHVHVIGAGTMGGDIAAWCAARGMKVTLQDRAPKNIAPAIARAYSLFQKTLKKPRAVQAAMDRLIPDPEGYGIPLADVIIEAVFEDLQVKCDVFKNLEIKAKPTAILATNTSSIPLDDISQTMQNPSRLIGIHFFNPVAKMLLAEVVISTKTTPSLSAQAFAFLKQLDRLPLPVQSKPGFLVNRILMPYLLEGMQLYIEGTPALMIDKAAVDFGMPMGPVELADAVGLDICLAVAKDLVKYYGGVVPENIQTLVSQGHLGKKTGQGFYKYKKGKPDKGLSVKHPEQAVDIVAVGERMILRLLNEAMACLREGIVSDADLLDAGMIFGTGFAPFHGGPMQYAKSLGFKQVKAHLLNLQQQFGERFKPDAGWEQEE